MGAPRAVRRGCHGDLPAWLLDSVSDLNLSFVPAILAILDIYHYATGAHLKKPAGYSLAHCRETLETIQTSGREKLAA